MAMQIGSAWAADAPREGSQVALYEASPSLNEDEVQPLLLARKLEDGQSRVLAEDLAGNVGGDEIANSPVTESVWFYFALLAVLVGTCLLIFVHEAPLTSPAYKPKALPHKVIVVRHGEKFDEKVDPGILPDDLNQRGFDRAICLAQLFENEPIQHIYVYTNAHSRRPFETMLPLAIHHEVNIDTSIGRKNAVGLAHEISKLPKDEGTIVVCWGHRWIKDIGKALGVKDAPTYPGSVYDEMWTIQNGELTTTEQYC